MLPSVVKRFFMPVHHRRLSTPLIYPALALLLTVWQTGYARTDGEWQDDADRDKTYTRVLVVGLSPEYNLRCEYEWFMVSQIRSEYTQAVASCDHMPSTEKLSKDGVAAIIKEEKVDAVLTTQLIAQKQQAETGEGGRDTQGADLYKATGYGYENGYNGAYGYYGGFGGYGIPVTYVQLEVLPPITTIEGKVSVISMLFDTANDKLVYEVKVHAKNLTSTDDALAAIADPTGKRLRRAGLIR